MVAIGKLVVTTVISYARERYWQAADTATAPGSDAKMLDKNPLIFYALPSLLYNITNVVMFVTVGTISPGSHIHSLLLGHSTRVCTRSSKPCQNFCSLHRRDNATLEPENCQHGSHGFMTIIVRSPCKHMCICAPQYLVSLMSPTQRHLRLPSRLGGADAHISEAEIDQIQMDRHCHPNAGRSRECW